jgi:hypothetical protein
MTELTDPPRHVPEQLRRTIDDLAATFAGIHPRETVARLVVDSYDRLAESARDHRLPARAGGPVSAGPAARDRHRGRTPDARPPRGAVRLRPQRRPQPSPRPRGLIDRAQLGCLLAARTAPRTPEVDHHDLPAPRREPDLPAAEQPPVTSEAGGRCASGMNRSTGIAGWCAADRCSADQPAQPPAATTTAPTSSTSPSALC